jgi:hypothetical protein
LRKHSCEQPKQQEYLALVQEVKREANMPDIAEGTSFLTPN